MIDQAKSIVAAVAIIALTVVAAHWRTGRVKAAEKAAALDGSGEAKQGGHAPTIVYLLATPGRIRTNDRSAGL